MSNHHNVSAVVLDWQGIVDKAFPDITHTYVMLATFIRLLHSHYNTADDVSGK